MAVAVALVVISLMTRMLFFFSSGKQTKLKLPPGPTPFPLIGSLHLLGAHPHKSLANLARQYGPLMSIQLGQKHFIVATSPDAAKEFLKLQDSNFCARAPIRASELIIPQDLVFNDTRTPVFRHMRKVLVSELTSAKRLQESKHVRAEEVAYMLRTISKERDRPIGVKSHFHIMSSNVLSRVILSKRFLGSSSCGETSSVATTAAAADEGEIMEFVHIVEEMASCFGCIHLHDFFDVQVPIKWLDFRGLDERFRRLKARMDLFYTNMVNQHMENRRKNPISEEEKTLLDVLLEQLDNQEYDITETHINGLIWDAFAGGSDTTMLTSEWAMAEVLRNPAVLQRARSELDRVVGRDRTVRESDIPELKYMQAILKEVLRLHAPFPTLVPRMAINATTAFGYDIPAKARLFVNVWGIARDPEVWETPLEFVPERFLTRDGVEAGRDFKGQHYEFTPFGSGRRACVGMEFASIVVHLQVASLLHAFDWELPGGLAPEKLDMTEGQGYTLPKRDPLVAIAKPRLPPHLY